MYLISVFKVWLYEFYGICFFLVMRMGDFYVKGKMCLGLGLVIGGKINSIIIVLNYCFVMI